MTNDIHTLFIHLTNEFEKMQKEREMEQEQSASKTLLIEGLERGNSLLMARYNNLQSSTNTISHAHFNILAENSRMAIDIQSMREMIGENNAELKSREQLLAEQGKEIERLTHLSAGQLEIIGLRDEEIRNRNKTVEDKINIIGEQKDTIAVLTSTLQQLKTKISSAPDRSDLVEKLIREYVDAPEANPDKWAKQQLIQVLILSEIHSEMRSMRDLIQAIATPVQEALLEHSK